MTSAPLSLFGQWLRTSRLALGWSQAKLGRLAEVHRLQVHAIESGRTRLPHVATRQRLYAALGRTCADDVVVASGVGGERRRSECAFCRVAADPGPMWLFRSCVRPQVAICQTCLGLATQQAAVDARKRHGPRPEPRTRARLGLCSPTR